MSIFSMCWVVRSGSFYILPSPSIIKISFWTGFRTSIILLLPHVVIPWTMVAIGLLLIPTFFTIIVAKVTNICHSPIIISRPSLTCMSYASCPRWVLAIRCACLTYSKIIFRWATLNTSSAVTDMFWSFCFISILSLTRILIIDKIVAQNTR